MLLLEAPEVKALSWLHPDYAPEAETDPDQEGPILASWFSGIICCPQGEQLKYVNMGYQYIYERDLLLSIENGQLIHTVTIDNKVRLDNARKRLIETFKTTNLYEIKKKWLLDAGLKQKSIDDYLIGLM